MAIELEPIAPPAVTVAYFSDWVDGFGRYHDPMNGQLPYPARLPSEDVILSAPMSYLGSAQRIWRLRRNVEPGWQLTAATTAVALLIVLVWVFVTIWYLTWGILLIPYRVLRRGQRRRRLEAMRHRELMGTIQGSAAASSAAVIAGGAPLPGVRSEPESSSPPLMMRIGDAERTATIEELHRHLMAGRLEPDEFEERLALTQRAKTHGDLAAIRSDLPELPPESR